MAAGVGEDSIAADAGAGVAAAPEAVLRLLTFWRSSVATRSRSCSIVFCISSIDLRNCSISSSRSCAEHGWDAARLHIAMQPTSSPLPQLREAMPNRILSPRRKPLRIRHRCSAAIGVSHQAQLFIAKRQSLLPSLAQSKAQTGRAPAVRSSDLPAPVARDPIRLRTPRSVPGVAPAPLGPASAH